MGLEPTNSGDTRALYQLSYLAICWWSPYFVTIYRQCDLWHLMFTKEPMSLDFLQARFVHSQMEENIKSYILRRLHCLIPINFCYDQRGHISKLVQLLLS